MLISVLLFPPATAKPPVGSLHALDLSSTKTFLAELRSPPVPQKRLPIPKRLVEQVEELLKDNPAGLWVSRFPMEFKVWKYSQRMFQNERVKLSALFCFITREVVCLCGGKEKIGGWNVDWSNINT